MKMQNDLIVQQEYIYSSLRAQLKERQARQQHAKRQFNKIQKDLKNLERDNLQLEQVLTSLLEARLGSSHQ